MYERFQKIVVDVFGRGGFLRRLVYNVGHGKGRLEVRDLFVLIVAYFIFDYGLRLGQSYEVTTSNHKLQSCLKVVRGE